MQSLHVKLELNESLDAKRSLLQSEMNFIKIAKDIQNYRDLRKKELSKKIAMRTSLNQASYAILKFKRSIPTVSTDKEETITKEEKVKFDSLEDELKNIQKRLERLNHSVI